jgi:dihydroorotate dehydrogenase (NAD+) catalytic subunit
MIPLTCIRHHEQTIHNMIIELAPTNPYGLTIANPVMVAAGCLGYGIDLARSASVERLGALVTPTTSLRGRRSSTPALIESAAGLIAIGAWPDRGLAHVLDRCAPIWATWRIPIILSVSGATIGEASDVLTQIEGCEGIAAIELDCSAGSERIAATIAAVRAATLLPLLVKLPASEQGLADLARAAEAAGADALVVAAAPLALWFGPTGECSEGRLCGPAWHPLALRFVATVANTVAIPVIGAGGIADAAGVRRMLTAGAQAVQIGSALLADPTLAARLADTVNG